MYSVKQRHEKTKEVYEDTRRELKFYQGKYIQLGQIIAKYSKKAAEMGEHPEVYMLEMLEELKAIYEIRETAADKRTAEEKIEELEVVWGHADAEAGEMADDESESETEDDESVSAESEPFEIDAVVSPSGSSIDMTIKLD